MEHPRYYDIIDMGGEEHRGTNNGGFTLTAAHTVNRERQQTIHFHMRFSTVRG